MKAKFPSVCVLAAVTSIASCVHALADTFWTNALSFDGTNDYVVFNRPVSNDFTIECWFRSTQVAGEDWQWYFGMGLVDGEVANVVPDFGLALGAGKLLFGTGGTNDLTLRSGVVADGQWHHAAATRAKSSGDMKLYVDGVLVDSGTHGTDTLAAPPQMRLGSLATGLNFFQGELDEVRIWNTVRTTEQIRQYLGHPLSGTEPNLAAYLRLDEGGGVTAFDGTTNGYDGTVNGPRWVGSSIPPWGSALMFDGTTNDYVKSANFAGFPSNAITVEFWIQGWDISKKGTPFSYATTASDNTFLVYHYTNFQIYVAGVATSPTGVSACDGRWHHIATTWSSGTGQCLLYRDGTLVYQTSLAAGMNLPGGGTLMLGQEQDAVGGKLDPTQAFAGRLDEVRIWNRVRSQTEILADLGQPLTGNESNLLAYWKFDERAGMTAYDGTTNGHYGTLASDMNWNESTIQAFININAGLPGVDWSSVAWGDYDNDGRLDILLTGQASSGVIAQVWRNTGSGFTNINAGLPGVYQGSAAWGDYDNDGHLDILLTGYGYSGWIAQVWRNTGNGFTNINAGLTGVWNNSVAWGDYDNDGRLDILLTGRGNSDTIAQIWRNTGNGFTNINAGLPGVDRSSVAWGDYDNDGRLDILLTGEASSGGIAQVWRNTGDGFSNINAGLPGVWYGSVAWGDYDNDGRLDILLTGQGGSGVIAQVWRNTGSGFTNINAGLPGVSYSSAAWSDYDNDGRLDILLTGYWRVAQVWRNTGSGFVNINIDLPGVNQSSAAWGDYDHDGRLDILLTGNGGSSYIAQVRRNIGPVPNTPPTPPTGLVATTAGTTATLSWNSADDSQTPANTLTYNLRVGTTPGGSDVVSPQANPLTGFRRLPAMGNVQLGLAATLTNLPARTYYWSVQAIDGAFAGSPFAAEGSWFIGAPQPSIRMAGPDAFVIFFPSQPGQTYRVEYTDTLNSTTWLSLADGLVGTGSLIQVTNTGGPLPSQRFYRVALLPL